MADAGDAGGDRHTGQPVAAVKRGIADAGDAGGDSDAGQPVGSVKRGIADAGDAGGDSVSVPLPHRILNQRGPTLIKEHPIQTAESRVGYVHRDCGQESAVAEWVSADAGDAGGDGDARQPDAGFECRISDAGDAGGERDARQPCAVPERVTSNAGEAGREGDARQPGAEFECRLSDAGDAGGDSDASQAGAARKRGISDAGDTDGDSVSACFAAGILNERGPGLVEEHTVQAAVARVGRVYRDRCQPGAVVECLTADAGDAGRDGDALQPGAGPECVTADAGDAVRNDHGGDGRLVVECLVADGGDRQPIDRARNAHRPARAGVAGDGDGVARDSVFEAAGGAFGHEDSVRAGRGSNGAGRGEPEVIGGVRHETGEIRTDILGRDTVVG